MIALLLAAVLQVGPPAPVSPEDQMLELIKRQEKTEHDVKVVKGTVRDFLVMSAGGAFDVWSTEWGLDRRPGRFEETNARGFSSGARISWKALSVVVMTFGCRELRKDGHHKTATILSTFFGGSYALVGARNMRMAR